MNVNMDIMTLTAAAADGNTPDLPNLYGKGVQLGINITAIGGTGTPAIVVTIQGQDATSGQYYDLLASASLTGAGFTRMTVYPGVVAATNAAANQVLPHNWRVKWAITGTNPVFTGTIGASLIE